MQQAGRADLAALGAWYERLLRAIAAESAAACIVDASKEMRQALMLAGAGVDVRVIHLIRDVRGVAFSMSKRHAAQPGPGEQDRADLANLARPRGGPVGRRAETGEASSAVAASR